MKFTWGERSFEPWEKKNFPPTKSSFRYNMALDDEKDRKTIYDSVLLTCSLSMCMLGQLCYIHQLKCPVYNYQNALDDSDHPGIPAGHLSNKKIQNEQG